MLKLDGTENSNETLELGGVKFWISRPQASFGLVIDGVVERRTDGDGHRSFPSSEFDAAKFQSDYLHQHLLQPKQRSEFFDLIAKEGLVVCRKVDSDHPNYRKVRGKSSNQKLSQAEYYHHDGCSCPQNPRLVEIRLPYQELNRNVATAVAPFPAVIQAMLQALPAGLQRDSELNDFRAKFRDSIYWNFDRQQFLTQLQKSASLSQNSSCEGQPAAASFVAQWDKMQGQMIRLARREMDAASCRAYYRQVDELAGAFVLPWTMGESRLMLNFDPRPEITLQHRRAYQKQREEHEQNGHLVKRWTAEEI